MNRRQETARRRRRRDRMRQVRALMTDTDTYVFGGLAILALGLGWVYLPLAPITVGAVLLTLGIWLSLPPSGKREG